MLYAFKGLNLTPERHKEWKNWNTQYINCYHQKTSPIDIAKGKKIWKTSIFNWVVSGNDLQAFLFFLFHYILQTFFFCIMLYAVKHKARTNERYEDEVECDFVEMCNINENSDSCFTKVLRCDNICAWL